MLTVSLPDGSKKQFENAVTVREVAESIGSGLARAALAARVDDVLRDIDFLLDQDVDLKIITSKDLDSLEIIRHSAAHLLAQAVKQLFPTAQVTIGPVIEDGFYYDFSLPRPLTAEDLTQIEERMVALVKQSLPVKRQVMSREEAIAFFQQQGEHYKVQIIEAIPADEVLTVYQQGDFYDLCRGPHVPNTACLSAFKLMKFSGAYWRGDSKNEMLQRIYGTAWANQQDLQAYLTRLAEAEKRDHRKLGKAMNLFHLQEEAPGMVFWHAKGWTIYRQIMAYISEVLLKNGYAEVRTPQIIDRSLWEKSGHWQNFREEMFVIPIEEQDHYVVKPMNCPAHIQIFNQGIRSYRDLPLRLAEFGSCHRYEPSGTLHGLMRLRGFMQDDGHIFCTEDQIQTEVADFIKLLFKAYRDFGFEDVILKLSTRPLNRVGSNENWDKAEQALQQALDSLQLPWHLAPGEGAFYGPKIEFSLRDCLGRIWQCGTIQVDFSMPQRLGTSYIAEDGSKKIPVMLHRAICGSLERFIGILIEHYAGCLPLWLAPHQVVVMNITDSQAEYAKRVANSLEEQGIRPLLDLRNEKVGFKIREHTLQRIPYLLVVGEREMQTDSVAVRTQKGEDLGTQPLAELMPKLQKAIFSRVSVNIL